MGLQADMRAAAVTLLSDYAADASVKLQVYPGRPRSINPPCAFVNAIRETLDHTTALTKRSPIVEMIVLHGLFDSQSAADQKDAFVNGFIDWVETRFHAAGANTIAGISETEDIPDYVNDWMPPAEQRTYYATRIALEGFQG